MFLVQGYRILSVARQATMLSTMEGRRGRRGISILDFKPKILDGLVIFNILANYATFGQLTIA